MALTIGADDKKKIYILAILAGALCIIGVVVFNPFGPSVDEATLDTAGTTPATTVADPNATPPPAGGSPDAAPPAADPAAEAPAEAPPAPGGITPRLIAAKDARPDPFTPYYVEAIEPPPPPAPVPGPLDLPGINGVSPAGLDGLALPGPGATTTNTSLQGLPAVSIPNYRRRTTPRLSSPTAAGIDGRTAQRSTNKRMAGVIIGDSVRALIEIRDATRVITRVVQPGDEVEGIKILRIERITENDAQVTRMTVLENGQERFFDLQQSPNPIANAVGIDGGLPPE
jgi:hypothetical protein